MAKRNEIIEGNEIDLMELIKAVWSKKFFVLKVLGICMVLGLIIAFTSKVEYEAQCKLLPETGDSNLPNIGSLGGLAGLAGINLDIGSSEGLNTQLYPVITKTTPFLWETINKPVFFENEDTIISSFQYFEFLDSYSLVGAIYAYSLGLPGKIKKFFSTETSMSKDRKYSRFSQNDWEIIEEFADRISVLVNEETGVVTITVEMPDAYASAEVTEVVVDELTTKVSQYRTEKSRVNLEFILGRFEEAKGQYEIKQMNLARFSDRNRNITTSIVQNEYERLQNEMNIAFEVYKGLAAQLEQAKIKLKEDTPVFTVLEPVKIPEDKSKPHRLVIILLFIFFGFIYSLVKIAVGSTK